VSVPQITLQRLLRTWLANKFATSPQLPRLQRSYGETCHVCNGFWALHRSALWAPLTDIRVLVDREEQGGGRVPGCYEWGDAWGRGAPFPLRLGSVPLAREFFWNFQAKMLGSVYFYCTKLLVARHRDHAKA